MFIFSIILAPNSDPMHFTTLPNMLWPPPNNWDALCSAGSFPLDCIPRYQDYSTAKIDLCYCNTFFSFIIFECWKSIKLCSYIVWTWWFLLEWFRSCIKKMYWKTVKLSYMLNFGQKSVWCLRLLSQFK